MSRPKAISLPPEMLDEGVRVGRGDHPLRELIADLLDELPEADRHILEMFAFEDLTYAEIAEDQGLAGRQGAQYRVRKSLAKLAALLEREGITYGE